MRKSSGITRKSKDPRMIVIQSKMKTLDIQINTAENGILLPSISKVPFLKEALYLTNSYKEELFDRLSSINNIKYSLGELNKINPEMDGGTL